MSVTAAPGFSASGIACGIKESGAPDLAVVASEDGCPVPVAAVFTSNRMTAAPVLVSRSHLVRSQGRAAGVVLNSGNANAATGARGTADAEAMCRALAGALGVEEVHTLVCSTGLIGIPLPLDRILAALPDAVGQLGSSPGHGGAAAEAIRTTDTFTKEVVVAGNGFTVGGMAKGAAMLAPNMATMLAVLTTDLAIEPSELQRSLRTAVDASFNLVTTDGCTSTNDTVIAFANGRGAAADPEHVSEVLTTACRDLAMQMVADAEGATKSVHLEVVGARSDADARLGARRVADSNLCKCSWYGQDPYWGRLASELGAAGIDFDPDRLSIAYGGVTVAAGGISVPHDASAVAAHLAGRDLHIRADLGIGDGRAEVFTNDLTHAYVDENMGTS